MLLAIIACSIPFARAIKNVSLVIFLMVSCVWLLTNRGKFKRDQIALGALLIPLFTLLSAFFALEPHQAVRGVGSVFTISMFFICVRGLSLSREEIVEIFLYLCIGTLLSILIAAYRYFLLNHSYLELPGVGHVNHSALYILLIFVISTCAYLFDYYASKQAKYLLCFTSYVTFIGVFLSGSRAAIYVVCIILIALVFLTLKYRKIKWPHVLGLISFVLFLILFLSNTYFVQKILMGTHDPIRKNLYLSLVKSWRDIHHYWFGIGLGNTQYIHLKNYYAESYFSTIPHAHNTYLNFLIERGIIGLLLYIVLTTYIFIELSKSLFKNISVPVLIAWIACIVNFIVSMVNTTFHHENALLMMFIWALALSEIDNGSLLNIKR